MAPLRVQPVRSGAIWRLVRRQHGVISRSQLIELGLTRDAIKHRVARGRLRRVQPGVFAVGGVVLGERGRWMAAVLTCGPGAVLSHHSAAALWGVDSHRRPVGAAAPPAGQIEVTVRNGRRPRRKGIRVHRTRRGRPSWSPDFTTVYGIPTTSPARTLLDLAVVVTEGRLESLVNEADKLDLVDSDELRREIAGRGGEPGARSLRRLLDRDTFRLTDSELERRFLRLVRGAGLPPPETGARLNGFVVDFFWPDLGLVVETDGLRYHRTPAQQSRDRMRDQAHAMAGLTPLRFTNAQVAFEADEVRRILRALAARSAEGRRRG